MCLADSRWRGGGGGGVPPRQSLSRGLALNYNFLHPEPLVLPKLLCTPPWRKPDSAESIGEKAIQTCPRGTVTPQLVTLSRTSMTLGGAGR